MTVVFQRKTFQELLIVIGSIFMALFFVALWGAPLALSIVCATNFRGSIGTTILFLVYYICHTGWIGYNTPISKQGMLIGVESIYLPKICWAWLFFIRFIGPVILFITMWIPLIILRIENNPFGETERIQARNNYVFCFYLVYLCLLLPVTGVFLLLFRFEDESGSEKSEKKDAEKKGEQTPKTEEICAEC